MTRRTGSTPRGLLLALNLGGTVLVMALAASVVVALRTQSGRTNADARGAGVQQAAPTGASPPPAGSASPGVTPVSPAASDGGDLRRPDVRRLPADVLPTQVSVRTRADVAAAEPIVWPAFSEWDRVLLGRFLAIDDLVDQYSSYYGNDYLWQFAAYCSESTLNPIAKGTDPGDRGLGQVGDESGTTAAHWASDPGNVYYLPGFDASRSPWDPETNLVLSSVILRSFYAMPRVIDNESAYAHLTYGLAAEDSSGAITPQAQERVTRAASFIDRLTAYTQLKHAFRANTAAGEGRFSANSPAPDPLVAQLLALDETYRDGEPMYAALRTFYLEQAEASDDLWTKATYIGEASTLDRLLVHVYGNEDDDTHVAVLTAVDNLTSLASTSPDSRLLQYVDQIQAEQALPPGS